MRFYLLLSLAAFGLGQTGGFGQTGVFQTTNPNYPVRNPFYFEGKIDYEKLGIVSPGNAWEYMQRGIHRQDVLEDRAGAIEDYQESIRLNNIGTGSCQVVKSVPAQDFGKLDPPPCMFTVRLRLGYLRMHEDPDNAIALFREVLEIDPRRLDVNNMIGEAYQILAEKSQSSDEGQNFYRQAVAAYQAELALSPVTARSISLTGDEANNAHTHWALAGIHEKLGDAPSAISEYELYLKATKWHSDVYPWRIPLAKKKIEQLHASQGN